MRAVRAVAVVFLLLSVLLAFPGCGSPDSTPFRVSIDPTSHQRYGLTYPVTYKFTIPSSLTDARAYKRSGGAWWQLPNYTSTDFFNGIESARFDYAAHCAYISASFGGTGDDYHLCVTDAGGNLQPVSFVEICEYYDNRRCVVSGNADLDASFGSQDNFTSAVAHACYEMWVAKCTGTRMPNTAMVISDAPTDNTEIMWADLQRAIDGGYVEIGGHSRTHPCPTGGSDSEVGGCVVDITDNLALPWWQCSGGREFVSAWAEPCNLTNPQQRAKLAQYDYLCDRGHGEENQWGWSEWASDGLYSTCQQTVSWGAIAGWTPAAESLNAKFDYAYSNGLILYHWGHPVFWNDSAEEFFDYISGKTDVWYVGFGSLYMYHYCQERNVVQVERDGTVHFEA